MQVHLPPKLMAKKLMTMSAVAKKQELLCDVAVGEMRILPLDVVACENLSRNSIANGRQRDNVIEIESELLLEATD